MRAGFCLSLVSSCHMRTERNMISHCSTPSPTMHATIASTKSKFNNMFYNNADTCTVTDSRKIISHDYKEPETEYVAC